MFASDCVMISRKYFLRSGRKKKSYREIINVRYGVFIYNCDMIEEKGKENGLQVLFDGGDRESNETVHESG